MLSSIPSNKSNSTVSNRDLQDLVPAWLWPRPPPPVPARALALMQTSAWICLTESPPLPVLQSWFPHTVGVSSVRAPSWVDMAAVPHHCRCPSRGPFAMGLGKGPGRTLQGGGALPRILLLTPFIAHRLEPGYLDSILKSFYCGAWTQFTSGPLFYQPGKTRNTSSSVFVFASVSFIYTQS